MAEVQGPELLTPYAGLLATARARKPPGYAKQILARARASMGIDSTSQIETSNAFSEGSNSSSIPLSQTTRELNEDSLLNSMNAFDIFLDTEADLPSKFLQRNDALETEECKKLESIEKWFNQLEAPTLADRVQYQAAKRKLDIIKKKSEKRKQLEEQEEERQFEQKWPEKSDNELFVPQDPVLMLLEQSHKQDSVQIPYPTPALKPVKKRQKNRISAEAKRRSMQVGFETLREKLQKKNGVEKFKDTNVGRETNRKRKRGPKKDTKDRELDVLSNLHANVVEEAHASAALPALEAFTARNRQDVISQMLASIPTENQEEAKSDAEMLQNAFRKFTNRVSPDGNGSFRMKGLKTSMYHYQVLGCAFMRDRENSPDEPRGGILGDVMGIGKTFEALVNIIDGIPSDPDDPIRTTLIVVPSHLVDHWVDQMRTHCDEAAIGEVVHYHAQARLLTLDDVKSLQKFRIVITTYDEVRRSYPIFKPPKELSEEASLWEQWQDEFEKNIGPLHRINFHRIVLDEAHTIKNRKSSVSIAVRGLTGQHKWVLSGTPVLNSNKEFYPQFDFLGVPHVVNNDYGHFLSYYCNEELGQQRLANLLRTYMYRRTHSSRLFSLPIINLPDIHETRHDLSFSEAEWVIYLAIQDICLEEINDAGKAPDFILAQCKCFLTMILKLRMFCSHPLMVQNIIKYLLRSDSLMGDLVKISREGSRESTSVKIVHWLKTVKKNYNFLVQQRKTELQDQAEANKIFTDNPSLIARFQKMMNKLHNDQEWFERYDRGACAKCDKPDPDKPVVTSCMHLYCEECFCQLHQEAKNVEAEKLEIKEMARARPICTKCTTPIEEATRCGCNETIEPEKQPTAATRKERSRLLSKKKGKANKNGERSEKEIPLPKADKGAGAGNNPEDGEEDTEEGEKDWINACGAKMPSAKLTGIRAIIKEWKKQSEATKVVIFSQFTDFIRILAEMCEEEEWGYRCLTGQMRVQARHKHLNEFKTRPAISVLIVSLHTGGTGLDMTIAHKCILVDLWWNEAVQNQAFCRLLRHGQTQNVECVKTVVEESIDDYLLAIQDKKTKEIGNTMGESALRKRDTVVDLLKLFADVSTDGDGRLFVKPLPRQNRRGKLKAALLAAKENHGVE